MSLLVTGSIAIDTVKTPFGISENCLGGSAVYFSMAASLLGPVRLLGVVGADFPFDLSEVFAGRNVDLTGLEVRTGSKTFRWSGSYKGAMNQATTENLSLNVLAEQPPTLPETYRDSEYVFLANTAPALQIELLEQVAKPAFVAADTMNCWIENEIDDLRRLLGKVDALIFNDAEALLLTGWQDLAAAQHVLKMGPKVVVIKRGEHGCFVAGSKASTFQLPAFPTNDVKDPTGAGDSFAGAFMGYIAKSGRFDFDTLKTAAAYGTAVASFAIEDFSLNKLASIDSTEVEDRVKKLKEMAPF